MKFVRKKMFCAKKVTKLPDLTVLRGLSCLSSWVQQPAADQNGYLATFSEFELAGSGVGAAADYNCCLARFK